MALVQLQRRIFVSADNIQHTIAGEIRSGQPIGREHVLIYVNAHHPLEGVIAPVVHIQPAGVVNVARDNIRIAVPVDIGHHQCAGDLSIGADVQSRNAAKRIRRAIVNVDSIALPGGSAAVSGDNIQVPVAVHIRQRQCIGIVGFERDIGTGYPVKGIGPAIIQIHPFFLSKIPRHDIQTSIAIHIAHGDGPRGESIRGDIGARNP